MADQPKAVKRSAGGVDVSAVWTGVAWENLPRHTREAVRRNMDAIADTLAEYVGVGS